MDQSKVQTKAKTWNIRRDIAILIIINMVALSFFTISTLYKDSQPLTTDDITAENIDEIESRSDLFHLVTIHVFFKALYEEDPDESNFGYRGLVRT